MPQNMHNDYLTKTMASLRDELADAACRADLIRAADIAEQLFYEITPGQSYPCHALATHLYEAHGFDGELEQASGEVMQHDLRRLIEDVSDVAELRADEVGEPVHTIDELSKMWNVSTKTINRWREAGLIGRKFLFERKKHVGFLRSSANRFAYHNPRRIQRGSSFRHLSELDRRGILEAVRHFAASRKSRSQVFTAVARRMNCSVETVRTTVKRHELRYPEKPLFADGDSPLSTSVLRRIYASFRRGAAIETLAERYQRSPSTIRRLVNQRRAESVQELPLDAMFSDEFTDPSIGEEAILGPAPEPPRKRQPRAPKDLPAYLTALYDVPLLTHGEENHLFRKMNYLKWQANQLREQLDLERPSSKLLDRIEMLYDEAVETKNRVVRANLRLVVSIVRKRIAPMQDLFELVSDGNVSLLRAVDKYDYSRGFKFSTYASWAIVKNLARTVPAEFKHSARFRTSQDEMLDTRRDHRSNRFWIEDQQRVHEVQVDSILKHLNERERRIIVRRFGLGENLEPRTLKELGEELGVTKERVRQLQTRAMNKLRSAAEDAKIIPPAPD